MHVLTATSSLIHPPGLLQRVAHTVLCFDLGWGGGGKKVGVGIG